MSELQASAAQTDSDLVPSHVAIIMDGNHRWAKARHLPGAAGHRAGARNIRPIAERCADLGVRYLTIFALSTENLDRPKREVDLLLQLMRRFLEDNVEELQIDDVEPLRAEQESFVGAVAGNHPSVVSAEDGLAAVEVAERIVAAIKPQIL